MNITVETPVIETPRVMQTAGMFDLTVEQTSRVSWEVSLPLRERPWNIGLIAGPSGSGKSTIARHLFKDALWLDTLSPWPSHQAIVDGFPEPMSIKEVTELLSSVGFSSPPAWLRPYHVLSNGQKFRCDLARLLALSSSSLVTGHSSLISVCDEFTSVVDRQVAQVGSAAIAKAIRKRGLKFLALTCHFDVTDWLQPDWIYRPDENTFSWRLLQRRPAIPLDIIRVAPSAWPLFAPHHYLSHDVNHSAACFFASVHGEPAAISSWLPFVGSGPSSRREHRTVVLPDYQGVGIGMALSDALASMWTALGYVARSTTTHPAFIAARRRSRNWRMVRSPRLGGRGDILKHATTRATAGFEYIGPPMEWIAATRLLAERL